MYSLFSRLHLSCVVNHENQSPVLCSTFSTDGSTVFTGGADKAVRMWQLGQQPSNGIPQQVGVHDEAVKSVGFCSSSNLVVSGSWDKYLKFWDCRQSTPAHQVQLTDKVYDLTVQGNLLVVACANRILYAFNVGGATPMQHERKESPLKHQTRCVTVFPDSTGYALGSIEGRVSIQYIQKPVGKDSFAFKCHRQDTSNVYSVNGISFHRNYGTFATVGSDGVVNFWDKDNKQRLKVFPSKNETISCASFNTPGNIFAYGLSYDWSKGASNYNPSTAKNEIRMFAVKEEDIRPKKKR